MNKDLVCPEMSCIPEHPSHWSRRLGTIFVSSPFQVAELWVLVLPGARMMVLEDCPYTEVGTDPMGRQC